jgi:CubicO group peptidase (beta-lactamase class C family)
MGSTSAIDGALREATASNTVPGIVAMAATSDRVIYQNAFGVRGVDTAQPMTMDSVFWIASMTKAITTVAAMQLVEQGALNLDADIGAIAPEFASPQVLDGFADDGTPRLRPAKGPMTPRHLMTHTAGFCYDIWNPDMLAFMKATATPRTATGKPQALQVPLAFDPGARWEYGINTDVLGRLIELASGQRLDVYLRDNVFAPLGMASTGFRLTPDMRERRVRVHARLPDDGVEPIDMEMLQDPEQYMGGGGLYSTAADYLRFTRMILNRGRAESGARVLREKTIAAMAQNQIGEIDMTPLPSAMGNFSNPVDFYPEQVKKWGLGFMINTEPTREGRSAGSLAWAGLPNCYYWIDPARDVAGVILMQVLPFVDARCLDAFAAFERGIYALLDGAGRAE